MRALPTGTMATDKCVLHAAQMPKGRKYIEFGSTTTNFIRLIVFFTTKTGQVYKRAIFGKSLQLTFVSQRHTIPVCLLFESAWARAHFAQCSPPDVIRSTAKNHTNLYRENRKYLIRNDNTITT